MPAAKASSIRCGPSSTARSPLLRNSRRISFSTLFLGLTIMPADLREFWRRFQSGVEVAVDAAGPDRLLGVRDGFLRYFHDGLERPVPVAVVAQESVRSAVGLATSDEQAILRGRSE